MSQGEIRLWTNDKTRQWRTLPLFGEVKKLIERHTRTIQLYLQHN